MKYSVSKVLSSLGFQPRKGYMYKFYMPDGSTHLLDAYQIKKDIGTRFGLVEKLRDFKDAIKIETGLENVSHAVVYTREGNYFTVSGTDNRGW